MLSYFDSIAEAKGLNKVIFIIPRIKLARSTGNKNCQAETPAALVTTNSLVLVKLQNEAMPPNKTAKGKIFCAIKGSFNNPISSIRAILMLGWFDALLSNSTVSIRKIIAKNIIKTVKKFFRKRRPMYFVRVSDRRIYFNSI
tara:strand:- start:5734 stop:6159 length:426 start_codon:yes stop_codon:yes gene_type:complete